MVEQLCHRSGLYHKPKLRLSRVAGVDVEAVNRESTKQNC